MAAEIVDIAAGALDNCSSNESTITGVILPEDAELDGVAPKKRIIRWRRLLPLLFFAVGKSADIAVDWAIVVESYNGSLAQRIDAPAIRVAAVVIAVLGTSVEACALVLKLIVWLKPGLIGRSDRGSATRKLREIILNRYLAIPRFVFDDLPATIFGIFILATARANLPDVMLANGTALFIDGDIANVTRCVTSETIVSFVDGSTTPLVIKEVAECEATEVVTVADEVFGSAELWLILVSVTYSIFAFIYYLRKKPRGIADELKQQGVNLEELRKEGLSASDLKAAGFTASELKVAGFTASELRAAGFTSSELRAAGFTASELKVAGYELPELLSAGFAELDLSSSDIGNEEAKALASTLEGNAVLTDLNLGNNFIRAEGAAAIAEALRGNAVLTKLNLDGHELDLPKLRGTDPVESLDLTSKDLGPASAIVIASLIAGNGVLTELDLSGSPLGGRKIGNEGAAAIAEALRGNRVLKTLNLRNNNIRAEGATAIAEALRGNEVLTNLELYRNNIGDEGAKAIGGALAVNGVLTSLDVSFNGLTEEAALGIVRVERQRNKLTSLGLASCSIGPTGAAEIAEYVSGSGVLTDLNLTCNNLGDEGEKALRDAKGEIFSNAVDAVSNRVWFELKM